jgi:hypothetical protein
MDTVYPHLSLLKDAFDNGLSLKGADQVKVIADESQISIQGNTNVFLIIEDAPIIEVIKDVRKISAVRFRQEWSIVSVISNSEDQLVTSPLIISLGKWQYRIIQILCTDILGKGGPIQLSELPKPEPIKGGAIAGRVRFGTQFVLSMG